MQALVVSGVRRWARIGHASAISSNRMRLAFASRRVTAWIAVLAVLAAAWLPPSAHASGDAVRAYPLEICTAGGMLVQDGADGEAGWPPAGWSLSGHCPLCSPAPVLPPSANSGGFSVPAPPAVALAVPRDCGPYLAAPDWPAVQPRAPPGCSVIA